MNLTRRIAFAFLVVLTLSAGQCSLESPYFIIFLTSLPYDPFSVSASSPADVQFLNPDVLTSRNGGSLASVLQRQSDCSLTELLVDPTHAYKPQSRITHIDTALHQSTGLHSRAGVFAHGCQDTRIGAGGDLFSVVGATASGNYYAAAISQTNSPSVVVYVANITSGVVAQNTINLTTPDGTNTLGLIGVGDLNGDGKSDLVVTIAGSYTAGGAVGELAVALGNGDGTFAAPVYYPLPYAGARGVTLNDFNGDGHLDVAVSGQAQLTPGTITSWLAVLPGYGDGTLGSAMAGPSGIGGANLVSADLNGDGAIDLVTGDGHIALGNNSGSFSVVGNQTVDSFASSIAVGDFDNDGNADLAIIAKNGGSGVNGATLSVWRGGGDGHFTRQTPGYPTVYDVYPLPAVGATELDGDGNLDLVVGTFGSGVYGPGLNTVGSTQLLLGRGDGSFASPAAYANASPLIADFNGDGKPDLLGFSTSPAGLQPWLGDGNGGFQRGPLSTQSFTPAFASAASLLTDLNNDQHADVVYIHPTGNTDVGSVIHTRLGNGDGTFHTSGTDLAVPFALPLTPGKHPLASGILTASGHTDLIVLGIDPQSQTNAVYALFGDGSGGFAAPVMLDSGLGAATGVVAADLNGDGRADLVVIDSGQPYAFPTVGGSLRVYLNSGTGSFQPAVLLAGIANPADVALADLNGDGRPDIVAINIGNAGNGTDDTLVSYFGNANGSFGTAHSSDLPGNGFSALSLADIDHNGSIDAVIAQCCGYSFSFLALGNGDGTFATAAAIPLAVSNNALAIADLNGDGRPDLVSMRANEADVFLTPGNVIFCNGFDAPSGICKNGTP